MNPVIVFKSLYSNIFPHPAVVGLVRGIALAYILSRGRARLFGEVMEGIDS